ncbi:hypothetical protein QNO07_09630 [Streptomyces sp. 549]|uniref:hypothetical protein n=1 Tax=Streptomyces sp. 549 TaxID=3049076 RepID=UPI0024C2F7F0|nr:hypothetical protein [Streptomyces sp. 549]MDK1473680.1 hypothetical protein [Streptomyces sp. 549]
MTGYALYGAMFVAVAVATLAYRALAEAGQPRRRTARFDADTSGRLLACAGTCPSLLTRHDDHGDGTATCRACGRPRLVPEAREDRDWLEVGE